MAATVLHRLVIRHPREPAALLVRDGDRWRLPQLDLEERHSAEVEHLNAAVLTHFGLHTTVLRGLDHSTTPAGTRRTHELEAHEPGGVPRSHASARWFTLSQLSVLARDDASLRDDAPLLHCCLAPNSDEDRTEAWMRPGWWPAVQSWIESRLGAAAIVQTRSWESSCVARVEQPCARFFFKAVPANGAREARVTAALARLAAPGAPEVVAADLERHWLLMRAFAGRSLDDVRDPTAWASAVATYGRLQAATLERVDELRALGCVERRLDDLVAAIDPLLADTKALMPDHPEGLAAEQIAALRRLAPELRRHAETLAAAAIPVGLDHGDLWPSNLLVDHDRCVVIDWEDAGINQPFLSLGPFLAMLRQWRIELDLEQLAAAYLPPFAAARPLPALRRAFDAALPLGLFEMAVRYRRMPVAVTDLHPWMREMVPFFLRHLLEGWGLGPGSSERNVERKTRSLDH